MSVWSEGPVPAIARRMYSFAREHQELLLTVITAIAIGGAGTCLACIGNPKNSGICVSCFMENLAGAMGLHGNVRMQYIRPELLGFVLGATLLALATREFRATGGSSPLLRFAGGVFMIVGCAMFMGCPIRLVLRLGHGDWTTFSGVLGLVAGVWVGWQFLRRGFHLGDARPQHPLNGLLIPLLMGGLLLAWFFRPSFIHFSQLGPGAQYPHSSWLPLATGLFIGALAQRSRFCMTGGIGTFFATRDVSLLAGVITMPIFVFLLSYIQGPFRAGFEGQPGSHLAYGWSFLGMALVGLLSSLMGGCPFRQLVLAGQGNSDAGAAVLGLLAGGAIVQGWSFASTSMGPTQAGQKATLVGLALTLLCGSLLRERD